ncbi:MAG: conserved rane protein of unknown function [Parcubacteria group bacterium]|nr:conserved rane protein of unknown function [Parcubacteria group bacterium]
MKTTLSLLALFIFVLVGGYLYSTHQSAAITNSAVPAPVDTSGTTGDAGTQSSTSTVTTSTKTTQTTTTPSSYTLVQVATHGNASSCWSAINGNVYNLTSWISQHPGGEGRILSICGKDGSSAFDGQHGSDPRAQAQLATFKIGALSS